MFDLEARFAKVSRGRPVFVKFDSQDFLFASDFQVAFKEDGNKFDVVLRRGGCFEGAYRCLERFIEAEAERIDGVDSAPPDHLDLRRCMEFWIIEKIYDQFVADLESAIADKVSWLEHTRPGEGMFGEVAVEARTRALLGLQAHLQCAHHEVRKGILSLETIRLLKAIGLDVFSENSNE